MSNCQYNIITIQDLLAFDNEKFVYNAQGKIIGTPISHDVLLYYMRGLNDGRFTKDDIIVSLRLSPQGRQNNVKIIGFNSCLARSFFRQLPVSRTIAYARYKSIEEQSKYQWKQVTRKKSDALLSERLDVILITYNRINFLKRTLESILSESSPIKNVSITIFDNASTDGSSEICHQYAQMHKNIFHFRHRKNIGGNANICRAYEYATKEYVWVIADDDGYDWSFWHEVENAMDENYDCIQLCILNQERRRTESAMIYDTTFVPGNIYKAENITSDILQGMYANCAHYLPHLTLSLAMYSSGKRFFQVQSSVVVQTPKFEDNPSTATKDNMRGIVNNYSPFTQNKFWEAGFLAMLDILDSSKHKKIVSDIHFLYGGKDKYLLYLIENYKFHECSSRNLFDIYWGLNKSQKLRFVELLFADSKRKKLEKPPLSLQEWNLILADAIITTRKVESARFSFLYSQFVQKFLNLCVKVGRKLYET